MALKEVHFEKEQSSMMKFIKAKPEVMYWHFPTWVIRQYYYRIAIYDRVDVAYISDGVA